MNLTRQQHADLVEILERAITTHHESWSAQTRVGLAGMAAHERQLHESAKELHQLALAHPVPEPPHAPPKKSQDDMAK